jgi:hypothetical protein
MRQPFSNLCVLCVSAVNLSKAIRRDAEVADKTMRAGRVDAASILKPLRSLRLCGKSFDLLLAIN